MIEKKLFKQKVNQNLIENYVYATLGRLSCSSIDLRRTPLGEKVTVYTSKPGLVVGRKGENIRALTEGLKKEFGMENPQIEVSEIVNPKLDARTVAKGIVEGFMRFGARRFKVMAYHAVDSVMDAGALGVEIVVSGRGLPSVRSRTWRFNAGYLKKSGQVSEALVDKAIESADIKTGTVGVQVSILRKDVVLPDSITIVESAVSEEVVDNSNVKKDVAVPAASEEKSVDGESVKS